MSSDPHHEHHAPDHGRPPPHVHHPHDEEFRPRPHHAHVEPMFAALHHEDHVVEAEPSSRRWTWLLVLLALGGALAFAMAWALG